MFVIILDTIKGRYKLYKIKNMFAPVTSMEQEQTRMSHFKVNKFQPHKVALPVCHSFWLLYSGIHNSCN